MKYIKLIIGLFMISFISSHTLGVGTDNLVKIRQLYQDTKTKIAGGNLIQSKFDYIANEKVSEDIMEYVDFNGPTCKFYWPVKDKKLIFAEVFMANGGIITNEEYLFYQNSELAFYYKKTSNAIDKKIVSEERYYYANKNLIRYMVDDKVTDKGFSSEITSLSKGKIDKSEVLKKAFTMVNELGIKLRY